MTYLIITACLLGKRVFENESNWSFVCAILAMPPKSKARRAKADNLEIVTRKIRRLEDNEGGSSEVRAESLEGSNLSELLNMSEDSLEALDSVDPTFDAEASARMDEDDVGEVL